MGQKQGYSLVEHIDPTQPILGEHWRSRGMGSAERHGDHEQSDDSACVRFAKKLHQLRARRLGYFDNKAIFGEPCWDILLSLFINQAGARRVDLHRLAAMSDCSEIIALRWLKVLANEALVELVHDEAHEASLGVTLSVKGYEAMRRYLDEAAASEAEAHD